MLGAQSLRPLSTSPAFFHSLRLYISIYTIEKLTWSQKENVSNWNIEKLKKRRVVVEVIRLTDVQGWER